MIDREIGFVEMVKSGVLAWFTVTVTIVESDRLPLVPVTFTAYEPVAADVGTVTVRTELPVCPALRVTGFGLNELKGPVGETVAERLTEPVKPFWLVMLIVEVVEEP